MKYNRYKLQQNESGKYIVMALDKLESACKCDTFEKMMNCSSSIGFEDCYRRFPNGTFWKQHWVPLMIDGKELEFDTEKDITNYFLGFDAYLELIKKLEENRKWMKENSCEGLKKLGWVHREQENEKLLFAIAWFKHIFEK